MNTIVYLIKVVILRESSVVYGSEFPVRIYYINNILTLIKGLRGVYCLFVKES